MSEEDFNSWLEIWSNSIDDQEEAALRKLIAEIIKFSNFQFSKPPQKVINTKNLPTLWTLFINLNTNEVTFYFEEIKLDYSDNSIKIDVNNLSLRIIYNCNNISHAILREFMDEEFLIDQLNVMANQLFEFHKHDSPSSQHIAKNLFVSCLCLITQIIELAPEHYPVKNKKKKEQFAKLDNYITSHLVLSSQEISEKMGLSIQYTNRLCRITTSCSVSEYINIKRLERAWFLLTISKVSMNEISKLCGFKTPAYFSKLFQERFCLPPKQYIKLLQKETLSEEDLVKIHQTKESIVLPSLEETKKLRSKPEKQQHILLFIANTLPEDLNCYWVDALGEHVPLGLIKANLRIHFGSSPGQYWVFKDKNNNTIGTYMTETQSCTAILSKKVDKIIYDS